MSEAETAELELLMSQMGSQVGLTRRDPGNSGPVVVTWPDGYTRELAEAA